MIVVGLLSGTSMDAIDVAAAEFSRDGDVVVVRPVFAGEHPWPDELRARLLAVLAPAGTTAGELCRLDTVLGQEFARAVPDVGAELVVSHGQTVFHWVAAGEARGTLQLGQPAWIAERTGLPVVSDLRARDIAAGGHGAPLASTLDILWLRGSGVATAALNLGGIANVTLVDAAAPLAFDTGPANCLLDLVAARCGDLEYDVDGRLALAGTVRADLLDRLLAEPYFAAPPPKSTGRELFGANWLEAALAGLDLVEDADLLATLVELTAVTVANACTAAGVDRVVASGGGVRNPALLARLRARLGKAQVVSTDDLGLPADAKEAFVFALLGYLTWHGVPGVLAGVTGSRAPRVLGSITPGVDALRLPPPATPPTRLIVAHS